MNYEIIQGDCLKVMTELPKRGINLVVTDPPYGTTACKWDTIIPFAPMWDLLKGLVKTDRAIVLFGSQPFSSALVMSNASMFKYQWVWKKMCGAAFLNAKNAPIKIHEDILVFSEGAAANGSKRNMLYNPQGIRAVSRTRNRTGGYSQAVGMRPSRSRSYIQTVENYPISVLTFPNDRNMVHDTGKPVDLLRYLIRTYSNEGDTVLDFTCGSGSTGVACLLENRKFIGIEKDAEYAAIARGRLEAVVRQDDQSRSTTVRELRK